MKSTMSVQVDTDVLLALITHLRRSGGPQDPSDAIAHAINAWLGAQQGLAPQHGDPDGVRGYQWKSLFLPEGTVLRSWSYGKTNFARVEGNHIMYLGRAVSPNQFAQSFARSTRNAWTDLLIRRPSDKQFRLACRLRTECAEQGLATKDKLASPDPILQAPTEQEASLPPARVAGEQVQAPGWTLPERRKYRFRIEDVGFE